VSLGRAQNYVKSYTTRQGRFDARVDRRYGDWFLYGIPTPLLWLESDCLVDVDDGIPWAEEVIVELWP